MNRNRKTYERLIQKSQEAFLLAVELYNRPSIRYHVEGCTFFLCNAWELMLKAYLVKQNGEHSIYYAGKPGRTFSLEDCVRRVFTNKHDPLRKNLEIVIELRNVSTHFITDEYELFYGPILQACVKNYDEKMRELHEIEISDLIPENYLVLSVRRGTMDLETIRARYTPEVVDKMLAVGSSILASAEESGRYAGYYTTEFRITKKKDADFTVRVEKDADKAVAILHSLTNPFDKYTYRTKTGSKFIDEKLSKKNIHIWVNGVEKEHFNSYHFMVFVDFYDMKEDERFCCNFSLEGEQPSYGYSQQAIDLMIEQSLRDPIHVIDRMRDELTKRKKQ